MKEGNRGRGIFSQAGSSILNAGTQKKVKYFFKNPLAQHSRTPFPRKCFYDTPISGTTGYTKHPSLTKDREIEKLL